MRRRLPLLLLPLVALAGCGRGDADVGSSGSASASSGSAPAAVRTVVRTETVERVTRVEVPRGSTSASAAPEAAFDAEGIYRRESPGVVTVVSTGLREQGSAGTQAGLGSGFIVSGSGEVATNAHVVTSGEGAAIRPAQRVYVRFADGNSVPARVVGYDPFADVALLRIDPSGLDLRPLPLGSTRGLRVGAPVAAIGSPFGEEQSLSTGVISALQRQIDSLTGFSTSGAIQTDAAINQGNSGGPLLDADGDVLGINSQIRTSSGAGSGVGFAVPVDVVRRSLAQLRTTGRAQYAYLGVSSARIYPQLADDLGLGVDEGALVQSVVPGGPAAKAGIEAGDARRTFQEQSYRAGGDVIVEVAGRPVRDDDDLAQSLVDHAPGDSVPVVVVRGGKRRTVTVRLGARPLTAPAG